MDLADKVYDLEGVRLLERLALIYFELTEGFPCKFNFTCIAIAIYFV